MQTFLPFEDFEQCAKVLDRQRLGKQRVEVVQMLNALHEIKTGYRNHPCTRMWEGHELQLVHYGLIMCEEWIRRGYKDTQTKELNYHMGLVVDGDGYSMDKPEFLGSEAFHRAHQSTLLRKAHSMTDAQVKSSGIGRDYYDQFFPGVPDDIEIFYPGVL